MKKQYCTSCGTPNQFNANFCGSCGNPFSSFAKKKPIVKRVVEEIDDDDFDDDEDDDLEEIKSSFKKFDFDIDVTGPRRMKIGEVVGTNPEPLAPNKRTVTKKQVKESLQIYKKLASNNERPKENDL